MGKKKRGHPDLEEILNRPWCYYCERDFDDLKILISHQKAKHFKCDRCGRRLNTAGGLSVHMSQVHKESLTEVDNALPNRSGLDVEIFGMEGVPEDVLQAHNQRVMTQYHQAEADRRAATGNPAPGTAGTQQKKPKLESVSSLKQRLAEHKAKQAAASAGGGSGDVTPVGAGQGAQAATVYPQQQPYPAGQQPANGSAQQVPYPQPYGQPGAAYQPPATSFQAQPEYASPGYQTYPAAAQPFQTPQFSNSPMSPSQFQPGVSPIPQHGTTPPLPFQHQQQQPIRTHTPPQTSTFPPRPPSLPTAPGLPQRPSFGAPHVNTFQMQQMHHGQVPVAATRPQPYGADASPNGRSYSPAQTGAAVDDLISGAAKKADEQAGKSPQPTPTPKPEEAAATGDKAAKKEKSKPTRLVYSETEISPEEKMARLPRYAYVPENKEQTVLGDATTAAVAGIVQSSEDIVNPPA